MRKREAKQKSWELGILSDNTWSREWAIQKAAEQQMQLQDFDWQVINFARSFYQEYAIMPLTRRIIRFIRENLDSNFDSIQLQARYTNQPLRVIALISGFPRPIQCI